MDNNNQQYDDAYFSRQLKVRNNRLRRFIRGFYLRKIAGLTRGKSLDFGCGTGALLEKLEPGSIGIEVNQNAVNYCRQQKLDVRNLDFLGDQRVFDFLDEQNIRTIVINHVLEHFDEPEDVLKKLMQTASDNHVERLVIIVPGLAGFKSDRTHRTFIQKDFIQKHDLNGFAGFTLSRNYFFPINMQWFGNIFLYQELHMVLDRLNAENNMAVGEKGQQD